MWLPVAITAYFINAGVYLADKFLLSKKIHSSIVYSFYVGIWSIFNLFLLFFAPWVPSLNELLIDLSAGLLFLITLIFWYKALHQSEATRVVPIVGGLVPVFSLVFSMIFLGESLDEKQLLAFVILITGGVLISVKRTRFYMIKKVYDRVRSVFGDTLGEIHAKYRPGRRLLLNSIVSAFFFAAFYVLMKYIYLHQPFIGSFVWSRLGTFLGALFLLVVPSWRKDIFSYQESATAPKSLSFFLTVRLSAALAFIMLNWAIDLGNVAMVNALQGVQYLFFIIFAVIISVRFPKVFSEEIGKEILAQKLIGAGLVSIGLYMLVV
ncbi:MAG: EamA family transporter [Patescibacteria group bacterium]|jgi:drug/metabolite transporter (DMT)-like permease